MQDRGSRWRRSVLPSRMALLDRVRDFRRTRQLARDLGSIKVQLTRIADAAERLSPPPQGAPIPDTVEVEDVSLKLQAGYEIAEQNLRSRDGRDPTPDQVLAEYEQIKHLL